MRKINRGVAVSCFLLAASAYAAGDAPVQPVADATAAPTPYYAGFGVGQGRTILGTGLSNAGGMSYNLVAGYQFTRNLAAELSYVNLGPVMTASGVSGNTSSVGIAGVASFPLGRSVSGYVKFGAATVATAWATSPVGALNANQMVTGLNWGLGLRFAVVKNAEVRVGLDHYVVGVDDPLTGTATNASVSLLFRF